MSKVLGLDRLLTRFDLLLGIAITMTGIAVTAGFTYASVVDRVTAVEKANADIALERQEWRKWRESVSQELAGIRSDLKWAVNSRR